MTTDPQRYASLGGVPRAAGSGEKNIFGRIFEMSSSDIDVAAGSYDSVWGRYRAVGVSTVVWHVDGKIKNSQNRYDPKA